MKRVLFLSLVLLSIAFLFSACKVVQSLSPNAPTLAPGTLLLTDDFSKTPNGWGTMDDASGQVSFEYEGLTIQVNLPNSMVRTVNGYQFADARIEVDAALLEGPSNDHFGVICRYQDSSNYYAFVISHDGYFGIYKMVDGVIVLSENKTNLDYSEAIRKGGVVNHISATCNGEILSLTVNDTLLAEIQDSSFNEGQIGLTATAYGDPGVKILFDNLEIYQP